MSKSSKKEVWVPIPNWPNYIASSFGRIKGTKLLKQRFRKSGYREVKLSKNGETKTKLVHQLILASFVSESNGKHVNHIDGNKANNHISNLEWVTEAENKKHAAALGLMQHSENRHNAKLKNFEVIKIRELALSGVSHAKLAKKFGVCQPSITNIVNRKSWIHV